MSDAECVFCQITRREAPASIIYEDDEVTVFLSNRPVNVGHSLIVPRKHIVDIYEASEDEVAYLFRMAKRVAHAVAAATGVEAIRIVQNNGADAGQVIFHLHIHIIPMKPNNHLRFENQLRPMELLREDAEKIKQHL